MEIAFAPFGVTWFGYRCIPRCNRALAHRIDVANVNDHAPPVIAGHGPQDQIDKASAGAEAAKGRTAAAIYKAESERFIEAYRTGHVGGVHRHRADA